MNCRYNRKKKFRALIGLHRRNRPLRSIQLGKRGSHCKKEAEPEVGTGRGSMLSSQHGLYSQRIVHRWLKNRVEYGPEAKEVKSEVEQVNTVCTVIKNSYQIQMNNIKSEIELARKPN